MPHPLDAAAVRRWCTLGSRSLRAHCARMDAINVFPVPDGDTGTNLCLTFEAAAEAVPGPVSGPGAADVTAGAALRTMARAALLEARGNSGTILAEYLRGMAHGLNTPAPGHTPGTAPAPGTASGSAVALAAALRGGARAAYDAVAHPVEGTMLTVAAAAADAAGRGDDPAAAARRALAATPGQLGALARAGVVDAGALGLTVLLGALWTALGEDAPQEPVPSDATEPGREQEPGARTPAAPEPVLPGPGAGAGEDVPGAGHAGGSASGSGPEFEVMYLLEAEGADATDGAGGAGGAEGPGAADRIAALRARLDPLGDSLVIGGGDGLWSVHVHVHDAGAAVEAGLAAGRPHRIRIAHLPSAQEGPAACGAAPPPAPGRAVVAVVPGAGLAGLCREAGAATLSADAAADRDALLAAVRATGASEVALLPNATELHPVAARAADAARTEGIRCAVIPTRAAVQGLAALAVHQPDRRFDEDVVTMTSAAGATRYGEVTLAARQAWTSAGVCQAGDVLGLVEGDVALIGDDILQAAKDVLGRMLAPGGELVTLVLGEEAPDGLAAELEKHVKAAHLAVDTLVYTGRQHDAPLLIGVE
ncbi:DAK2 domain-containing protein [Streptomyces albus]|uniref:DAK2 domain-containing protein n=1 Tax=unclassified Streptomyces TaxID=2593676 RepID=UPI0004BE146A|nr:MULTISPECIES: DAK2 domain-containing protein [unclassified Streptomyces]